jgi:RimJ/RimL family protein N-acetyltransferase
MSRRPQPTLGAKGLVLRPWKLGDAPGLAAAYADPGIQHWHHRSMTEDEARQWIHGARERWRDETDADFAVEEAGRLVGRVALRMIVLAVGQCELSYWTLPGARGSGVATRAARGLSSWALQDLGLCRIEVRHSIENPGSCRVAEAAGYVHEATLARQHLHADGWHDVHVHTRFADPTPPPSA